MMDIDVLTAFVKVLAERKRDRHCSDEWLRGYNDAMDNVAELAQKTLETASMTVEVKDEI